jgi:sugar phosphate isomerase/epimerase
MIRFGPAAAPRWFDQDLTLLPRYLDLISDAGASAIEFIVLPGEGSLELGRIHLFERDVPSAVELAQARGLTVNLHAPLPAAFRLSEWAKNQDEYKARFASIVHMMYRIAQGQPAPPLLVMHAAAGEPELTADFLITAVEELHATAPSAGLSLELRAQSEPNDGRFDRDLRSLAEFVAGLGTAHVGICWDVAHDWENTGHISRLMPDLLSLINHVHIHDSRPGGEVHAPLGHGNVPWRQAIQQLIDAKWQGAITLEIRYRYATERGDPWMVLARNLIDVRTILAGE